MRYDAVLFDLDGTLTQSEPGITNCVKYALNKLGCPVGDRDELRKYIGPPLVEAFQSVAHLSEEQATRALELYRERFSAIGWKENSVYTGIAPLLRTLRQAGVYVAVATGKPQGFSEKIIDYFGLAPFIDRVVGVTMTDHHADKVSLVRKALPETYRRACMVGDRAGDIAGAKGNGIDGIGVLYGYGSRGELAQADFVAEDVASLSRFLLGDTPSAKGVFVSFEGSDGCGKSTQMKRARDYLTDCGYEVVVTREPGGTPLAERIREIILDVKSIGMTDECEALLYAAARAQHVSEVIKPAVEQGKVVLCDRFLDSSLAYQGEGRRMGMDVIRAMNEQAVKGCLPDKTLFYDLSPDKAMKRRLAEREPDRLELEKMDFVYRVYEGYRALAAAEPERFVTIDGDRSIEEVEQDTRTALIGLLGRH